MAKAHLLGLIDKSDSLPDVSDAELARRIGVPADFIRRLRTDGMRRLPTRSNLEAVAGALGKPYRQVLTAALRDMGYLTESDGPQSRRASELLTTALELLSLAQQRDPAAVKAKLAQFDRSLPVPSVKPFNPSVDQYPWVVWRLMRSDPHGRIRHNLAERSADTCKGVAAEYKCQYEYCVDDDTFMGTRYAEWFIGLPRHEHKHLLANIPKAINDLCCALIAAFPKELDYEPLWTATADAGATQQRNLVDHGYPNQT